MKRFFAILLLLAGAVITAYNFYEAILSRGRYYRGTFLVSSLVFTGIGLVLLGAGMGWWVALGKHPAAADTGLRSVGRIAATLGILAAAIALTVLLVHLRVFAHSVILVGFIPIPGQLFYATPLAVGIIACFYVWGKIK
jgi:hypothetical protein